MREADGSCWRTWDKHGRCLFDDPDDTWRHVDRCRRQRGSGPIAPGGAALEQVIEAWAGWQVDRLSGCYPVRIVEE